MTASVSPRCWVLIPAAGSGQRMNAEVPKQYLPLAGRAIIEYVLETLLGHPQTVAAVLTLDPGDRHWEALNWHSVKPLRVVAGGAERHLSVLSGLRALAEEAADHDWVLVHDAVRPCLRRTDLDRLIRELGDDPVGGLLAVKAKDTIKRADSAGMVAETLPRGALWHAQTPQMFRYGTLRRALEQAVRLMQPVTDEAAAIELFGLTPMLVEGHGDNIKITHPEDLPLAEYYLKLLGMV